MPLKKSLPKFYKYPSPQQENVVRKFSAPNYLVEVCVMSNRFVQIPRENIYIGAYWGKRAKRNSDIEFSRPKYW